MHVLTASGAEEQIFSANLRAFPMGSSETCEKIYVYQFRKLDEVSISLTSDTAPYSRASAAEISLPVSSSSAALAGPTILGKKCVAAIPGCNPNLVKVTPIFACEAQRPFKIFCDGHLTLRCVTLV